MKKAAVQSILVAVLLLALGVIAEAQQPKKVPRIGIKKSVIYGERRHTFVEYKDQNHAEIELKGRRDNRMRRKIGSSEKTIQCYLMLQAC